ncbi:MAG: AAA family ATPase [Bdellovibrionales bacterium]|nr:AAA family ATPase [Bdellovibrionales bacterium]
MNSTPIFGHQRVIEALRQAIAKNELHHTLLFSGPEGIGKRIVAKNLAATLLCDSQQDGEEKEAPTRIFGGCGQCHTCTVFRAGNLPDIFTISCSEKTSSSTEAVRELLHSLRLRPFSGKYRFLIFDDAHLLQGQAANALLKSLEEPRPGTFFILITGKPHLMLRTIHSRAQRWGFHRLNSEDLRSVIRSNIQEDQESPQVDESLLPLADGSYESYRLLEQFGSILEERQSALQKIAGGDRALALELGSSLAQTKETLRDELLCLHLLARKELAGTHSVQWATFLFELGEMDYYLLKRNFAPLYLLQNLFLHLADPHPERYVVEPSSTLEHRIAN